MTSVAGCGSVQGVNPDAPVENVEAPVNATTAGTIAEGGTLELAGKLVTADADTAPDALVYKVLALPAHGTLTKEDTQLAAGATFSQQDVNDGKVAYVHDGGETTADEFTWSLSDGVHEIPATGGISFTVTVTPVNDAPTIVNNPVTTLAEGGTEVFVSERLQAADAENGALTYTVLGVSRGEIQLEGAALVADDTFTQQDIADGKVQFVDSGIDDASLAAQQSTTATFQWKVSDPDGGVNPATGANSTMFTITPVDDPATVTWRTQRCATANTNVPADPLSAFSDVDNPATDYQLCVVSIDNGSYVIYTTGGSVGVTFSVAPVLQNGAVNLSVGSCVPMSARASLNLDYDYPNVNDRGYVRWKLMQGATQIGTEHTISFPGPSTPSC